MIRECIGIAPGAKFSVDEAQFIKLRFQKMNLKERQSALYFILLPVTYIYKGDPADLNTLRETDAIMLNPAGNWSTSEIQYLYIFNPTLHYPPPIICAFYMQNRCFSTP